MLNEMDVVTLMRLTSDPANTFPDPSEASSRVRTAQFGSPY